MARASTRWSRPASGRAPAPRSCRCCSAARSIAINWASPSARPWPISLTPWRSAASPAASAAMVYGCSSALELASDDRSGLAGQTVTPTGRNDSIRRRIKDKTCSSGCMLAPIFQTFMDRLREAADCEALTGALSGVTDAFGLGGFAYVSALEATPDLAPYLTTYPASWVTRYLHERYHEIDPVVLRAQRCTTPFHWDCHRPF